MRTTPLLLLALAACDPAPAASDDETDLPAETDGPDDTEVDDSEPPADTDVADTEPPADSDTGEPVDVDPGVPAGPVRFVALGDVGEGNPDQYAVADAMGEVCARDGCDFALMLGDNFYDDGVYAVDDAQFDAKFELPYADLDFPFYVVLGNHDFGEIPLQFWRTDFQVEYTLHSTKWTMPDHHYAFTAGDAVFFALDTNAIMLSLDGGAQQRWIRRQLAKHAAVPWKLAFGHHPWKSNGQHGNAGNYEGAFYDVTGVVRGDQVESFFQKELCGEIDLYLAGHDHNLQWIEAGGRCGVDFLVSGAGAKTTDLVGRDDNPTLFETDAVEGFVWIELDGNVATVRFYDRDAQLLHEGVITK